LLLTLQKSFIRFAYSFELNILRLALEPAWLRN
jgi:hypothetical protein